MSWFQCLMWIVMVSSFIYLFLMLILNTFLWVFDESNVLWNMKEWYDHKFCLKHCDSIKHCDYIVGTFGEILYSLFEKKNSHYYYLFIWVISQILCKKIYISNLKLKISEGISNLLLWRRISVWIWNRYSELVRPENKITTNLWAAVNLNFDHKLSQWERNEQVVSNGCYVGSFA